MALTMRPTGLDSQIDIDRGDKDYSVFQSRVSGWAHLRNPRRPRTPALVLGAQRRSEQASRFAD
jgi:hypothetical protein